MKYGLLYYKDTDNIGDDIQTYAAIRFLPHIDYYIDREALNCFIPREKEYVSVIMNAWYIHNKLAWPPSPYINPLLHSMHFTCLENIDIGEKYLQNMGGEYLKNFQPIGARDIETKKRLENNGIQAYFSGCMTLTLNRFENVEKKDKICLVDVPENIIEKVKQSTESKVEILTHWLDPEESSKKEFAKRMEDVESILKKYQEARLVITNRLHVALPCIALGTPVILIHKEVYEKDRLGSFLKYMTNFVDTKFLNMDIKEILKNPKPNNEEYLELRNSLIQKCEEFIENCEKNDFNIQNLPDIEEYYKNYVSKIDWYRKLHEETYIKSKQMIFDYEKYIKQLNEEKQNIINNQNQELESCRDELQKIKDELELFRQKANELQIQKDSVSTELSEVYNSKGWKFLEKLRNIKKRNK